MLGLGHMYAGAARRGLLVAVFGLAWAVFFLVVSMAAPSPVLRLGALAVVVCVIPLSVWDAARTARRANPFTPKWYNRWYLYVGLWLVAAFLVEPVITGGLQRHVARAFFAFSISMEPTLLRGDYLLTAPVRSGATIHRGMAAVYQGTDGGSYIQRIVGLPGDTLEMRGKTLSLNGRAYHEPYARHIDPHADPGDSLMLWQEPFLARDPDDYHPTRDNWGPLVVPQGQYFLLGDKRDNSYDSRYLGFVSRERIERRPVWIYFSRDPDIPAFRWERVGRSIE